MKADDFAAPSGDSFKFVDVGDTIEGTVTYVGDWQAQTNKFNNREEEVARIGIDTGNEVQYVWPRKGSAMASAIAEAMREARVQDLAEGVILKLRFDSTKDTGKGQPMKVFRAKVTPGEPAATADLEPF
jgi:uncharacterized protein YggE